MWLSIDKRSKIPMLRQVYEGFRARILSGELPAGRKLPSTRELAERHGVSRNIILEAYELLLAEGFIEGRPGCGTFVAEGAFLPGFVRLPDDRVPASAPVAVASAGDPPISFRTGLPALEWFPRRKWASLLQSVSLEASAEALGYGDPAGEPELRHALADYLFQTRGVIAGPDRIVITNGAVQALQLIASVLLAPGDEAIVEEPTNNDLKSILSMTGAEIRSIPVDESGLCTSLLPVKSRPKCIYVTPSHQFPLGGILPVQRRVELIRYASATGCCLLEDDYDSEFRYDGAPIHSLQSLDPERVVYIGTFSKVLFPALRIGYVVLPAPLVEPFVRLKRLTDYQTPSLDQLALTRFIEQGHLQSHIYKMKKIYRKRRQALVEALESHFPGRVRICGRSAGLHLVAEFDVLPLEGWTERLRQENVFAAPLAKNRLLLGYGHLSEDQIREGMNRLRRAIQRENGIGYSEDYEHQQALIELYNKLTEAEAEIANGAVGEDFLEVARKKRSGIRGKI